VNTVLAASLRGERQWSCLGEGRSWGGWVVGGERMAECLKKQVEGRQGVIDFYLRKQLAGQGGAGMGMELRAVCIF
jgi:hypothetical protein